MVFRSLSSTVCIVIEVERMVVLVATQIRSVFERDFAKKKNVFAD